MLLGTPCWQCQQTCHINRFPLYILHSLVTFFSAKVLLPYSIRLNFWCKICCNSHKTIFSNKKVIYVKYTYWGFDENSKELNFLLGNICACFLQLSLPTGCSYSYEHQACLLSNRLVSLLLGIIV